MVLRNSPESPDPGLPGKGPDFIDVLLWILFAAFIMWYLSIVPTLPLDF